MPDLFSVGMVFLILLLSSSLSTATGFGLAVLAIPLCAVFVGIKTAVPLLALASAVTSLFISLRERGNIDQPELRRMVVWIGIGFPVGNLAYHYLSIDMLKFLLGVFVSSVALHGLWRLYQRIPRQPWNFTAGRIILVTAGVVQGAVAAGGPLVVTYANNVIPEKQKFRATLFVIWIIFNSIFVASYFLGSEANLSVLWLCLVCFPALVAGSYFGQWLHHRASDTFFQVLVSCTLLLSGLSLLFR
jgi:uncharacterized protein